MQKSGGPQAGQQLLFHKYMKYIIKTNRTRLVRFNLHLKAENISPLQQTQYIEINEYKLNTRHDVFSVRSFFMLVQDDWSLENVAIETVINMAAAMPQSTD